MWALPAYYCWLRGCAASLGEIRVIAGLDDLEYHRQWYARNSGRKQLSTAILRAENPERCLFNSAKARAKRAGLEFSISISDIVIPAFCPVLSIPLFRSAGPGPKDNTPSVDRIKSSVGYVPGNVIVISMRANQIKSNASTDELRRIAAFYERF